MESEEHSVLRYGDIIKLNCENFNLFSKGISSSDLY